MVSKIIYVFLFFTLILINSNSHSADIQANKFGEGFKVETPAEIYPKQLLILKGQRNVDNSSSTSADPVKKAINLKLKETGTAVEEKQSDALSFKKIEETPTGSNSMFPDKGFRGSRGPDFVGSALGLTFGQ
jgi:hypothetical protein